jgi:hypothetical protein
MRQLLPLLALCLATAGCVTAGSTADPNATATPGTATATPPPNGYDVATGPNDLILRISVSGGLVAPGYILTELPQWALFGDGRIVVPGPLPEIYPGPLLRNLQVIRVTPAEIQKILAAADAAGLLGADASYMGVGIADAGTTFFTTVAGGKVHHVSAYALMADVKGPDAATDAARAKLRAFEGATLDLGKFLGRPIDDSETFEPAGLRVFVSAINAVDLPLPTPQVVSWPLAADPIATGQPTTAPGTVCVLVTGADLATFLPVAKSANAQTVWTRGKAMYSVGVRPLYPNEDSCAGSSL